MKRRDFIKRTVPATVLPFMLGGYTLKAYGRSPFLDRLLASSVDTDHVLVLIQLNGGNDGLNTVIPIGEEWVTPTGGGYFFAPSISALELLAS